VLLEGQLGEVLEELALTSSLEEDDPPDDDPPPPPLQEAMRRLK